MNSLIKFLTFNAERPTHVYEAAVYLLVRSIFAIAVLVSTVRVSAPTAKPLIVLSAVAMLVASWVAQTVRSGAHRRAEKRKHEGRSDVALPCDADLMRAASVGSFCASLSPVVALGLAAVNSGSSIAGLAAVMSALQSGFDVAWSEAIYPAWRRAYTERRDALRELRARVEWESRSDRFVKILCKACGGDGFKGLPFKTQFAAEEVTCERCAKVLKSRNRPCDFESDVEGASDRKRRLEAERIVALRNSKVGATKPSSAEVYALFSKFATNGTSNGEKRSETYCDTDDAETTVMSCDVLRPKSYGPLRPMPVERFVKFDSLEDLLERTKEDAPVGTYLYLNDDSPVVEFEGAGIGWSVDWHDGTRGKVFDLREGGKERERFLAMAEGRA